MNVQSFAFIVLANIIVISGLTLIFGPIHPLFTLVIGGFVGYISVKLFPS